MKCNYVSSTTSKHSCFTGSSNGFIVMVVSYFVTIPPFSVSSHYNGLSRKEFIIDDDDDHVRFFFKVTVMSNYPLIYNVY